LGSNALITALILAAQFLAVYSASILAVALRIGSLFSSRWRENRGAPAGARLSIQLNFSQLQSLMCDPLAERR
jgi:hypothetical protein